jgi:hypothetical protein
MLTLPFIQHRIFLILCSYCWKIITWINILYLLIR